MISPHPIIPKISLFAILMVPWSSFGVSEGVSASPPYLSVSSSFDSSCFPFLPYRKDKLAAFAIHLSLSMKKTSVLL